MENVGEGRAASASHDKARDETIAAVGGSAADEETFDEAREVEPRVESRGLRGAWAAFAAGGSAAYLAAGALAAGLLAGWLQFSTDSICCGDFDGYYHTRWSQLLWQGVRAGDFTPEFKWLPLTTLNARDYVDHHYLFHLLQSAFVPLGQTAPGRALASLLGVAPETVGPKISAWLFASLAIFACFWLVVRHRVRYPVVWLAALLGCSAPFLFRMNMTKAMSVSLVLLVVGIHLLFRRRYVWLLPLSFLFTLTYDMFVLLGVAACVWTAAVLWRERRFEWRPVAWVAVGVAAGLVINPYFPANVRLLYQHAVMKATREGFKTAVGNEWYPYDSWDFLRNCAVAFAAMLAGYVAFDGRGGRDRDPRTLFLLVFSTLLLVVNARWRRFAEYWPPFAVLFAAFSVDAALSAARSSFASDIAADEDGRRERWRFACAAVAAVALCVPVGVNAVAETNEIADSAPHADYRAGAEWMRDNLPPGEVVFNTDWDDFPKLFFYDPAHAYVSGLDPTYLYDQSPQLSKLYDDITLGREKDPGPLVRDRFGARYVFTDNEEVHDQFYFNARDSGWFDRVYSDDTCTVLRIRDQKGEPFVEEEEPGEGDGDGGDEDPDGAR